MPVDTKQFQQPGQFLTKLAYMCYQQDDLALTDVVKIQREFSSQLAELQKIIADQARKIDTLTESVVRLEAERNVSTSLRYNGAFTRLILLCILLFQSIMGSVALPASDVSASWVFGVWVSGMLSFEVD